MAKVIRPYYRESCFSGYAVEADGKIEKLFWSLRLAKIAAGPGAELRTDHLGDSPRVRLGELPDHPNARVEEK